MENTNFSDVVFVGDDVESEQTSVGVVGVEARGNGRLRGLRQSDLGEFARSGRVLDSVSARAERVADYSARQEFFARNAKNREQKRINENISE